MGVAFDPLPAHGLELFAERPLDQVVFPLDFHAFIGSAQDVAPVLECAHPFDQTPFHEGPEQLQEFLLPWTQDKPRAARRRDFLDAPPDPLQRLMHALPAHSKARWQKGSEWQMAGGKLSEDFFGGFVHTLVIHRCEQVSQAPEYEENVANFLRE